MKPSHSRESPFDHNIWVICGEGDIEEGISGEAASLAANQQLGNLTVIFDANRIQIEGDTNLVLAEDVLKRFQAYGWYTDEFSFIQPDGSYKEDVDGLAETIAKAQTAAPNQPKLIKVDTLIAWPTPGIEMTTGPLGQGFASAIGFAYGQRFERGLLDPQAPEGESPFDHNIWVICGE